VTLWLNNDNDNNDNNRLFIHKIREALLLAYMSSGIVNMVEYKTQLWVIHVGRLGETRNT